MSLSACLLHLDDILVHAKTFEQELIHLQMVCGKLKDANLKQNPKKCELFQKKVISLGHTIREEGIFTDKQKIEAVQNWQTSQTLTDVESFVGLCSCYKRFICGFANIEKMLHRLGEKGKPFQQSAEHFQSSNRLL